MGDRGREMVALIEDLYPICRSLSGDGVRRTLDRLGELIPLERHEVPTGTEVLDWRVPKEWNIRDAWIKDSSGRRVVDFRESNLHVVSYSRPVPPRRIARRELDAHLHSLPDHPTWIPYRTAYYDESWGFCVSDAVRRSMQDESYEICIDSSLEEGALSYAERVIPGASPEEFLISAHVCHPSLANDNLTGVAVATWLSRAIADRDLRYTYRFVFAPGTLGAIAWLARNRARAPRIVGGLTLVCLGLDRPLTQKRTLAGDTWIDRALPVAMLDCGSSAEAVDFHPYGYDERQYNSPGFRYPVGSLSRGPHGDFPEYHSSADDLSLVRGERLEEALDVLSTTVDMLETRGAVRSRSPYGEPQLGRHGLYGGPGTQAISDETRDAMLWVLQFADGSHDLLSVAERSGLRWSAVREACDRLVAAGLIERLSAETEERAGEV